MKARISRPYACAPDGYLVLKFAQNDLVEGRVAEMALADGAAVEAHEAPSLETKVSAPAEHKTAPKRGRKGSV